MPTTSHSIRGVQAVFDRYHALVAHQARDKATLFDYDCMSNATIEDAGPDGSVVFRFVVTPQYANLNEVMHGGAYGVLFGVYEYFVVDNWADQADMFTTTALGPIAKPGYWDFMGGVTRSLNISYLKAVPIGTTVWFRSRVVQHGKTMALIKGEMTNEDGKIVYATAEHHKVNVPMRVEHAKVKIPWDETVNETIKKVSTASKL